MLRFRLVERFPQHAEQYGPLLALHLLGHNAEKAQCSDGSRRHLNETQMEVEGSWPWIGGVRTENTLINEMPTITVDGGEAKCSHCRAWMST